MNRTTCEKCWPRIMVTMRAMTATAIKVSLIHMSSLAAPFLNFIENIGISLTRRKESIAEPAGIIQVLSVNAPTILFMSRYEMTANEPHIIAHAGVARSSHPLKTAITPRAPQRRFMDVMQFGIFSQDIYCGGYSGEDPPLPIPNREVKLTIADGTAPPGGRVGSCHESYDALSSYDDGVFSFLTI